MIKNDKVSQKEVIVNMPKETFYHLSAEKREKVEKALEKELGRTTFEKVAISKIIEEANIPRGSFYQYFEDKEDAIKYIVEKYILLEKETVKKILKETKGNIFEASLKIFDYITIKVHGNLKANLYKNIMQELKNKNINLFEEVEEIEELVDTTILNIQEPNEVKYIMKIIIALTRTASIKANTEILPVEEAKNELRKQIEILKRGMEKQERRI